MKLLRMLLLVLLAVLLPVRGALAAATLCTQGHHAGQASHGTTSAAPATGQHGMAGEAAHARHCGDASGPAQGADNDNDNDNDNGAVNADAPPQASGCHLCASCCSMTPLPASMPTLQTPVAAAGADFPAFSAAAASHQCGGQDRPPRRR